MTRNVLGCEFPKTIEGLETFCKRIFAVFYTLSQCMNECNNELVVERTHHFLGSSDAVDTLNSFFRVARRFIILFAPTLATTEGYRGAEGEERVMNQLFGEDGPTVMLLRRIVCNRARMHYKESIRFIRNNPVHHPLSLKGLKRMANREYPHELRSFVNELLNAEEYDNSTIIMKRNAHVTESGLILDEWINQHPETPEITENISVQYGDWDESNTHPNGIARGMLMAFGFAGIANCYLHPDRKNFIGHIIIADV